jgi:hypothetical protein
VLPPQLGSVWNIDLAALRANTLGFEVDRELAFLFDQDPDNTAVRKLVAGVCKIDAFAAVDSTVIASSTDNGVVAIAALHELTRSNVETCMQQLAKRAGTSLEIIDKDGMTHYRGLGRELDARWLADDVVAFVPFPREGDEDRSMLAKMTRGGLKDDALMMKLVTAPSARSAGWIVSRSYWNDGAPAYSALELRGNDVVIDARMFASDADGAKKLADDLESQVGMAPMLGGELGEALVAVLHDLHIEESGAEVKLYGTFHGADFMRLYRAWAHPKPHAD